MIIEALNRSPFAPVKVGKVGMRIIRQIRQQILLGHLTPGERLASELELIEEFGVSRQTLRESVTVMEYMGLLERRAGAKGGIYISSIDEEHVRECLFDFLAFKDFTLEHLFEVRLLLERYAVRLFASSCDPSTVKILNNINERMKETIAKNDFLQADQEAMQFHRAIAEATSNPVLSFLTGCVENLLISAKNDVALDKDYCERVLVGHVAIAKALEEGNVDQALTLIVADLEDVKCGLEDLLQRTPLQQRIEMMSI